MSNFNQELCQQLAQMVGQHQQMVGQSADQIERLLRLAENIQAPPIIVPADPVVAPADPVVAPADPVVVPADPVVAPADPVVVPADPVVVPADPVVAPAARRRRHRRRHNRQAELYIIEEQGSYTAEEMKETNDYTMIVEAIRFTGKVMLSCKHCKKDTHISNFSHGIRKRAEKGGMDQNFQVPKTCDRQQAVNSMCNPVNNKFYPVMRSNCSERKKQRFIDAREVRLAAVGIQTNPTKYR
jgi:hypothetical protein